MGIRKKVVRNRKNRPPPRHYTPPPDLKYIAGSGHVKTPQKAGLWVLKELEQEEGLVINWETKQKLTGLTRQTQSEVLNGNSSSVRTFHNIPDNGPDTRGRKSAFTRSMSAKVGRYIDLPEDKLSLEQRSAPWQTIVEEAGVELPKTKHRNQEGEFDSDCYEEVEPQTIARTMRKEEKIVTAVAKEENELRPSTSAYRLKFCDRFLGVKVDQSDGEKPHSCHWRDVVFVDEFHEGVGSQITMRIKRREGSRYEKKNIQWKTWTAKDDRQAAKELRTMEMLHVFVAVGYNYRKMIFYFVKNKVGKMDKEVYCEQILTQLAPELKERGLTLYHDADSAHTSKVVKDWCERNSLDVIIAPPDSPDLSICETMANPVKRMFHKKRSSTRAEAAKRFEQVFMKINE